MTSPRRQSRSLRPDSSSNSRRFLRHKRQGELIALMYKLKS
jgi:hypothetical protein